MRGKTASSVRLNVISVAIFDLTNWETSLIWKEIVETSTFNSAGDQGDMGLFFIGDKFSQPIRAELLIEGKL